MGTHTHEQVATLGGNVLIPKAPLPSSLSRAPTMHFFAHLGVVNLPSSRVDLISGNCPKFFQPNAGEKVGNHAKEWNMQACQGQDACLKHWMNWNCSEKCGFIINLRNFISCVSLIGDNSHLMFKPRYDSKKQQHLSRLWPPLTRPTTFHRNLWSWVGY